MNKPLAIISGPVDTFSGYGGRTRDFVKSLIKLKEDEWEIKLLSQRWGISSHGFLNEELDDEKDLISRIIPQINKQPDVWIQITVPNEFQPVGKHLNIGVTAGIETTVCDASWIEGLNRMDLNLVSSNHSKNVINASRFEKKDQNTNKSLGVVEITKPVEVLFEGVDLDIYYKKPYKITKVNKHISNIKEDFAFLFVGHWLPGDFKEDRKNVGYLIKMFLEVFKNRVKPPALILKTSMSSTSVIDRETILEKIESIRKTVNGRLPNIYLIHGELDDEDINELYNHPKIKSFVSFTKGEGFGRPLLEFSVIEKPIIASGWSGHTDFLDVDCSIMVGGEVKPIHPSAIVPNILIAESSWFEPDDNQASFALNEIFMNYKKYLPRAKKQAEISKTKFSLDKMTEKLDEILKEKTKPIPKYIPLQLPSLKSVKLPTLTTLK